MNKKTLVLVSFAFLLVGVILGYGISTYNYELKSGVISVTSTLSGNAQIAASVMIDYGDGRVTLISDVELETGQSMLAYMKKVAAAKSLNFEIKEYEGMGALITTIDDKTNGKDNRYWQFWVNNISPDVGASQYVVKPGDVIEWKFLNYKER